MLFTQERTGKISHPTQPPEQLKPEAERPGNADSSPSLAQADPGSYSEDSENVKRRGISSDFKKDAQRGGCLLSAPSNE